MELVARIEKGRSSFKMLTGKHIANKPLGRPSDRWDN